MYLAGHIATVGFGWCSNLQNAHEEKNNVSQFEKFDKTQEGNPRAGDDP